MSKSNVTLAALATDAATAYADAVTNNKGKGAAAVMAYDALQRAISDGLNKTEAADTIAAYFQASLAARGSKEKCGANKVTQLSLSADTALSNGVKRTATDVIGAVYLARVGKVEGGAERITATLLEHKGKDTAAIVQAIEALPRTASAKKDTALTVEKVQKMLDSILAEKWGEGDAKTVAGMLVTAAEKVAGSN